MKAESNMLVPRPWLLHDLKALDVHASTIGVCIPNILRLLRDETFASGAGEVSFLPGLDVCVTRRHRGGSRGALYI